MENITIQGMKVIIFIFITDTSKLIYCLEFSTVRATFAIIDIMNYKDLNCKSYI